MIRILIILMCVLKLSAADRPNIVWLVSEDNSAEWIDLYDPQGAKMPTVGALAAHGLVFNNAFSCAPVCSVARSTLISGTYAPKSGAQYHRRIKEVALPDGLHLFPSYLRKAGYYTTNNNKTDYNFSEPLEEAWDESSNKASFTKRKPGQPFFHVQNFFTTHESKLHFAKIDDARMAAVRADDRAIMAYHPNTDLFKYTYATYIKLHQDLDAQIAEFVSDLKRQGLMEDTIIFYFGDHGGVLPRGKGYIYNNGLHVPLVVYIPDKWKALAPADLGSRIDGHLQFIDFAPTVMRLAGVEIPSAMDGKPFLGQGVTLSELNTRDTSFGYADRFDEKYDMVRSVRKGSLRYMRNYQPFNCDALYNQYRYQMMAYQEWRQLYRDGKLTPAQRQFFEPRPPECLYDLAKDPYEVNNLASDSAYAAVLREMRTLLTTQLRSWPDTGFYPEPVVIQESAQSVREFALARRADITGYIATADLALRDFDQAKDGIAAALQSGDPWQRYWALIVCSGFGKQAAPFYDTAKALAASDAEELVSVRAVEFLALAGQADPAPLIASILKRTTDDDQVNLMLNSVVMLRDGPTHCDFSEFVTDLNKLPGGKAKLRVKYLMGTEGE